MRPPGILLLGGCLLLLNISPAAAGNSGNPPAYFKDCRYIVPQAIQHGAFCYLKAQVPVCCLHTGARDFIKKFDDFCTDQFPFTNEMLGRSMNTQTTVTTTTGACNPSNHEFLKLRTTPKPTTPKPNLNNCIRYVPLRSPSRYTMAALKNHPYCCFHPTVRQNPTAKKFCQRFGVFRRKREVPETGAWNPPNHEFLKLSTSGTGRKRREAGEEDADEFYEMTDNSPDPIEVTCCGSKEIRTCGQGVTCKNICGNEVSNLDLIGTETEEACNPEITEEVVGGRRKKRWAAASMASYRLNWCPGRIRENNWDVEQVNGIGVMGVKICCFHPSCRKMDHGKAGKKCHDKVSPIFHYKLT